MFLSKLYSAAGQNALVGVIGLCVPGMFLALNGLGAGGLEDSTINSNALTAMYTTFSIMGAFFSGAINNVLGHRITMFLSSITYIIYLVSLLTYNSTHSAAFVIAAGALLGLGSSIFWVSQGSIMMSYPLEHEKGNYISVFWIVYNFGATFGALFSFGLNYHNETKEVSPSTYGTFIGLIVLGTIMTMLLCPVGRVVRSDGSKVETPKELSLSDHIKGLKDVYTEWKLLILAPLFMASNFYYPYQFNTYNGILFNVRTRSLNNSFYWIMQVLAAPLWGKFLDFPGLSRKKRGLIGSAFLFSVLCCVWGGGYAVQATYSNLNLPTAIDFMDPGYFQRALVFMGYGLADFLVQSTSFWIMGNLSNDPQVLARYTGFYGCIQSAGSAIAWRTNAVGTNFIVEYFVNVGILATAGLCMIVVVSRFDNNNQIASNTIPVELNNKEDFSPQI